MITDADRKRVTDLALRALDTIEEDYGDDEIRLDDAILIWECTITSDGSSEGNWHSTTTRASVNIGMLRLAEHFMKVDD